VPPDPEPLDPELPLEPEPPEPRWSEDPLDELSEPLPGPLERASEPEPESPEPRTSPPEEEATAPEPGPLEPDALLELDPLEPDPLLELDPPEPDPLLELDPPEPDPDPLEPDPLASGPSPALSGCVMPGPEPFPTAFGGELCPSWPPRRRSSRGPPRLADSVATARGRRTGRELREDVAETAGGRCSTTGAAGGCDGRRTSPLATPTLTATIPAAASFATTAAAPPAAAASVAPGPGSSLDRTFRAQSIANAAPTSGRRAPSSRSVSRRLARWRRDSTAGAVSSSASASSW
jgi:hypothetical protein